MEQSDCVVVVRRVASSSITDRETLSLLLLDRGSRQPGVLGMCGKFTEECGLHSVLYVDLYSC